MRFIYIPIFLIYCSCNLSNTQTIFWDANRPMLPLNRLTKLSNSVHETSGLITYQDRIWTINDSGDASYIYEISAVDGKVENKIEVEDAQNKDWEVMSRDDLFLYIGDTGNNSHKRKKLTIYKIALSDLIESESKVRHLGIISFEYPANHPNYNCESMFIDGDKLYLLTKNNSGQNTQLFALNKNGEDQEAQLIGEFNCEGLATAASYVNEKLLILGYANHEHYQPFLWVINPFDISKPFTTTAKGYRLPQNLQFEAITHEAGNRYLLSNEKRGGDPAMLWELILN